MRSQALVIVDLSSPNVVLARAPPGEAGLPRLVSGRFPVVKEGGDQIMAGEIAVKADDSVKYTRISAALRTGISSGVGAHARLPIFPDASRCIAPVGR